MKVNAEAQKREEKKAQKNVRCEKKTHEKECNFFFSFRQSAASFHCVGVGRGN